MALNQGRNYGIDLLRMIAMFMVAVLHVLGQGGVLNQVYAYSGQYLTAWFLELAAYGSVNLFAMISGYVGVKSKYRVSNLVVLWLQVFLYSFGIAAIFAIARPELCSGKDLISYAFPVITKKYWYFSAYVCLFLFMPLLNAGVNAMSKQSLRRVIVAMILVFSVASSIGKEADYDTFILVSGYSGLWLMVMYAIGAYIGKYGMWEKVSKLGLFGIYLGCSAASLALKCFIPLLTGRFFDSSYYAKSIASFIAPLVLLGSIALLLLFSRLEFGDFAKKIIAFLSPGAFGVYIIHVHPLIWEHLMKGSFASVASLSPLLLAGAVLLGALGIYLVCSLIDLLRHAIFKSLEIKQCCAAVEKKLRKEEEKVGSRK